MRLRVVLVTILVVPLLFELYGESSAQTADEPTAAPPFIESPDPNPNVNPDPVPQPPQQDEHHPAEWTEQERNNAVFMLSELRGRVRTFPATAEDRLKLAQGLYLVGDLDAELDECRAALKLQPNNAGKKGMHLVKPRETLSQIARQYDTTVDAIVRANDLRGGDHLVAGKKLFIP